MKKITYVMLMAGCLIGFAVSSAMAQTETVTKEKWVQEVAPTTENLNDVCAIDANTAWAVGDGGIILKRHANGWWERIAEYEYSYQSYNFKGVHALKSNSKYVWIVGVNRADGKGVLLKTTTGNNETPTWDVVTDIYQSLPTAFKSVKFNDATHGYIIGENGTILQTTNGIDWVRRPSPPTWNSYDNNCTRDTLTVGYNSFWLDPANAANVWASGDNFGTMVNTYNSGLTWDTTGSRPFDKEYKFPQTITYQPYGTKYPNWGCDGINMSSFYTGLGFGRVGYTTNGGNTWQTQTDAYKFPDTTYWVKDVSVGGNDLWAVGTNGIIQKFPNRNMNAGIMVGRHDWGYDLNAISMCSDGNSGYVVGAGGIIMKGTKSAYYALQPPVIEWDLETPSLYKIKIEKIAPISVIPTCKVEVHHEHGTRYVVEFRKVT